jgi:hypothetical protein
VSTKVKAVYEEGKITGVTTTVVLAETQHKVKTQDLGSLEVAKQIEVVILCAYSP